MVLTEISKAITINGAEIEVIPDAVLTPELEEELRYVQRHPIEPLEIKLEVPMQIIEMSLIWDHRELDENARRLSNKGKIT